MLAVRGAVASEQGMIGARDNNLAVAIKEKERDLVAALDRQFALLRGPSTASTGQTWARR